jgi:DNA polymerase-3 subunit alpha
VLESLAKIGAFDAYATRATLLEQMESIRAGASGLKGDIEGQDGLFSGTAEAEKATDNFKIIEEYPQAELLSFEKELFGFYLTKHPMADALDEVSKMSSHQIENIDPQIHKGLKVTLGGYIVSVRQVLTKVKQEEMCFGTLDDGTGKIDFVLFPKTYVQFKHLMRQDAIILIKGTLDLREDSLNLQVEKVREPEIITPSIPDSEVNLLIIPRGTPKDKLQEVGKYLKSKPGHDTIVVIIPNGVQDTKMKLPYTVSWNEETKKHVEAMLATP